MLEGDPRTSVHDALTALEQKEWEALDAPSPFLSYAWLTARADTVAGHFRTIQVRAGGRLLAGAPCYLTDASSHPGYDPMQILEDAGGSPSRSEGLRPSIVVAAPGRAGGAVTLGGMDSELRAAALAAVVQAAENLAARKKAPIVAWPYLGEDVDSDLQTVLRARGYLNGVVDAQCYLPVIWSSFEEYLAHFKASGRRTIRREQESLARIGGRIEMGGGDLLGSELAELELHWRNKYGRAASLPKLLHQYALLQKNLGSMLRVFVAYRADIPIGFTVFVEKDRKWYARFGGFNYEVEGAFLYFNLLFYAPVRAAISHGIRCIDYSLKSYDAKRSRGCLLRNVLLFLRVPKPDETAIRDVLKRIDENCRTTFAAVAMAHKKSARV